MILSGITDAPPSLRRMESTSPSPADRRSAHVRVGAATVLAIAALLLLGSTRDPAQADTTVPATTPTIVPAQPAPQTTTPNDPDPGLRPDRGGPRDDDGPGFGFGAPTTPAPSTGGNQS